MNAPTIVIKAVKNNKQLSNSYKYKAIEFNVNKITWFLNNEINSIANLLDIIDDKETINDIYNDICALNLYIKQAQKELLELTTNQFNDHVVELSEIKIKVDHLENIINT